MTFGIAVGISPIREINHNPGGFTPTQSRGGTAGIVVVRRKLGRTAFFKGVIAINFVRFKILFLLFSAQSR